MSVIPPKAEVSLSRFDVRFVPKADMALHRNFNCFLSSMVPAKDLSTAWSLRHVPDGLIHRSGSCHCRKSWTGAKIFLFAKPVSAFAPGEIKMEMGCMGGICSRAEHC